LAGAVSDFMRPARPCRLSLVMMAAGSRLEARLAELLMTQLDPCDLGDGIEVVHDTEALEIEMECDLADPAPPPPAPPAPEELATTTQFTRIDDAGTHQFVRFSAPYERIEIQIDAKAFMRATIEDAKRLSRR
jgi:hypothetical protein